MALIGRAHFEPTIYIQRVRWVHLHYVVGLYSLHTMFEGLSLHNHTSSTPMIRSLDDSQGPSPFHGHFIRVERTLQYILYCCVFIHTVDISVTIFDFIATGNSVMETRSIIQPVSCQFKFPWEVIHTQFFQNTSFPPKCGCVNLWVFEGHLLGGRGGPVDCMGNNVHTYWINDDMMATLENVWSHILGHWLQHSTHHHLYFYGSQWRWLGSDHTKHYVWF